MLKKFLKSQRGQAIVEYTVIVAMLSIAAVTIMTTEGGNLNNTYNSIVDVDFGDEDDEKWIPKAVLSNGNLNFICDDISVEEYKEKKTDYKDNLGNTTIEKVYEVIPNSKAVFTMQSGKYLPDRDRSNVPGFSNFLGGEVSNEYSTVNFDKSFRKFNVMSLAGWFSMRYLTSVTNIENIDTSVLTDLTGMFYNTERLQSLNLNALDTSHITSFECMFRQCYDLETLDVEQWNTGDCRNMSRLFSDCRNLTNLNVSKWNTSNVQVFTATFQLCKKLTSISVGEWNTISATDMEHMFSGCAGLTSLNLNNFKTENVTTLYGMISKCENLQSIQITNWNVEYV